ncbi:MAG TPA: hypothetical protein VGO93_05790 [Candidatus Xenobia bacterium]|jgi:hypothetical protein
MKHQLNAGEHALVRSVVYREYKRLEAELTQAGEQQAERIAQRLLETFVDRFRDDPALREGEPRIRLTVAGDTVYRYPPQTINPQRLD